MRWVKERMKAGGTRTIKKFLLFPKTIMSKDHIETRWLETAYILQQVHVDSNNRMYWANICFVESEDE